jgi:hypothetical protein
MDLSQQAPSAHVFVVSPFLSNVLSTTIQKHIESYSSYIRYTQLKYRRQTFQDSLYSLVCLRLGPTIFSGITGNLGWWW